MPKVTVRCNAESDCRQLRCLYALPIRTRHYQRLGIKGVIPSSALRPRTGAPRPSPAPPTGRRCRTRSRARSASGRTRSTTLAGG